MARCDSLAAFLLLRVRAYAWHLWENAHDYDDDIVEGAINILECALSLSLLFPRIPSMPVRGTI